MKADWKSKYLIRDSSSCLVSLADFGPLDDISKLKTQLPVVGNGLIVKKSIAVPQENGLFATRAFVKNELITFYDGKITSYVHPSELDYKLVSHARSLIPLTYTILGNVDRNGTFF